MKYIIGEIKGKSVSCFGPVIFPEWCDHKQTAAKLGITNIQSAGFIDIDMDGKVRCYGESISLDIRSNPYDNPIIQKMFQDDN